MKRPAKRPAKEAEKEGGGATAGPTTIRRLGAGERRLHPVTPLRKTWAPLAACAGLILNNLESAGRWLTGLSVGNGLLIALGALLLAAGYGFASWWFTGFTVGTTELRIRTGLLFRRTAHIRLDRLQAVDVNRPLIGRLLGVATLKLDVIGSKDKDELAYLSERDATALRAELLARAAGFAPDTATDVGEAPVDELVRIAPRHLAVSLLLTGSVWGGLLVAVVVPPLLWLATGEFWLVVAASLPGLGAAWAAGAGRFISEYDWRVGESPDGLRIDHGLLDQAHETVPPGRVQTVRIIEPLLWRRRGWVRVELDVAGSDNHVLLPVAPRDLAHSVIARVLPGVAVPAAESLTRPPRRARWCMPFWWKGYGLMVTDAAFVARHGRLRRSVSLVPHAKVQSVRRTQGPWQRLHGVADLSVDTGANTSVTASQRDAEEAAALLLAQADRSRTGRHEARPDRWMTTNEQPGA